MGEAGRPPLLGALWGNSTAGCRDESPLPRESPRRVAQGGHSSERRLLCAAWSPVCSSSEAQVSCWGQTPAGSARGLQPQPAVF